MSKKTKPFFTTVFLALLLLSSVCMTMIPRVSATNVNIQDKSLPILSDVLNLDTSKYSIIAQEIPQDSYLNTFPQDNIRYYIESNQSSLDMIYTFLNGKLRMLDVLETVGSPMSTKVASNEIEMSKNFLANYQTYSGNSFYGDLKSMLENIDDKTNSTVLAKNVKLSVTAYDEGVTFRWIYSQNGVEAPDKCVALGYKNGSLKFFIDNWDLYKIGSTSINLSKEEATKIAMENAKTFSWKVGPDNETYEVVNFNLTDVAVTQLFFGNSLNANKMQRNQDLLTLYPMWRIGISLDKYYPGNVYGICVDIWADTKEVRHITEVFSTLDPSADEMASISDSATPLNTETVEQSQLSALTFYQMTLSILALSMLSVTIPLWLVKKKGIPRSRYLAVAGILFCLLMISTMSISISSVSADPRRRSTTWGSESTGVAGRKTQAEIDQQQLTAQHISDYFKNDGYAANNYQGSQGSFKYQILDNINVNERDYDRAAVVIFDHGVGNQGYDASNPTDFHFMFEDNVGTIPPPPSPAPDHTHGVYDTDVFDETTRKKTFFVYASFCMSAKLDLNIPGGGTLGTGDWGANDGNPIGMPYAWTHGRTPGVDMSQNGYGATADSGAHCYIGFPYGSASLTQEVDPNDHPGKYYWMWLEDFLWYALSWEMTITEALDHASVENFDDYFGNTDLHTGFTAKWYGLQDGVGSTMAVYGNGNMRLYEYFVHYPYYTSSSAGSGLVSNQNGFTGAQPDASYTRLRAINVNDQATIIGSMGYSGANLANGHIWVYGYSSSYTSRLRVYASYYSDSGWQPVGDVYVSPGGARWIDCGNYASNFRYISFAVYRQSAGDYSNDLYLDNVIVLPPLPNP